MDHLVLVHVRERVADAAGDLHGVPERQRARPFITSLERLALQIFHHDVGPRLRRVTSKKRRISG